MVRTPNTRHIIGCCRLDPTKQRTIRGELVLETKIKTPNYEYKGEIHTKLMTRRENIKNLLSFAKIKSKSSLNYCKTVDGIVSRLSAIFEPNFSDFGALREKSDFSSFQNRSLCCSDLSREIESQLTFVFHGFLQCFKPAGNRWLSFQIKLSFAENGNLQVCNR